MFLKYSVIKIQSLFWRWILEQKLSKLWYFTRITKKELCEIPGILRDFWKESAVWVKNDPDIAKLFCNKLRSEEDDNAYKDRVGSAAYIPTFSKIIKRLTSNLFSQDLHAVEAADHNDSSTSGETLDDNARNYYKTFADNVDGNGTSLHNWLKSLTDKLITSGLAFFAVDFSSKIASNLLEQEVLGLDQPRLFNIDTASVFDYKLDAKNPEQFEWIKIVSSYQHQPDAFSELAYIYNVKIWSMKDGLAHYDMYECDPIPASKLIEDSRLFKLIDSGDTSFKCIPVCKVQLDPGLCVGTRLAPMAAELFNRTTIEKHSTNKACITVPVVFKGDMFVGSGLPDTITADNMRGRHPINRVNNSGVLELGQHDNFKIVESTGSALQFIHEQNKDLEQKMHEVVSQMGMSLKSNSAISAASKQEDRHDTEMLLTSIADRVYSIAKWIFRLIGSVRCENINWDIQGLSSSGQDDREVLLKEAAALPTLSLPSVTLKKEYIYRIGSKLVEGIDQRTLQTIRKEIEESIDASPQEQIGSKTTDGTNAADLSSNSNKDDNATIPEELSTKITKSGNKYAGDDAHLSTGDHQDAQTVYDQLLGDYKEADIQWVLNFSWRLVEVSTNSINYALEETWAASQPGPNGLEKVDMFVKKMKEQGFNKPVILVNTPHNNNKMEVIDGRHRCLAARKADLTVMAYVADVGSVHEKTSWMTMHGKQK